jgi:hypothetical protein
MGFDGAGARAPIAADLVAVIAGLALIDVTVAAHLAGGFAHVRVGSSHGRALAGIRLARASHGVGRACREKPGAHERNNHGSVKQGVWFHGQFVPCGRQSLQGRGHKAAKLKPTPK